MKLLPADAKSAQIAAELLLNGEVIAFPTETVYGIGCLAGSINGMEQMRAIKGRDAAKPFQVLIPSVASASAYAVVSEQAHKIMAKFFPGPLTLVLPDGQGGTTGVRMPKSDWLLSVMKITRKAIVATSANLSGEPPAVCADDVKKALGKNQKVRLIVDGGKCEVAVSSTVAAVEKNGEIKILRQGVISKEELESV